jgi:preprotein translocase subunit SecE
MAMSSDVVRPRDQRPAPGGAKGAAPAPGTPAAPGGPARLVQFYHDVLGEMKRVSWPDRKTLQDATVRIIVFVLLLGALIALMDLGLQFLLVRLPALLFGR